MESLDKHLLDTFIYGTQLGKTFDYCSHKANLQRQKIQQILVILH